MKRKTALLVAVIAAVAIVATACGSSDSGEASSATTTEAAAITVAETTETTMAMMPLPDSAKDMKLTLSSPSADQVVTGNEVSITVEASGFDLSTDYAGKPLADGQGHYHILLDKSLVDMSGSTTDTVSMQNVKPGKHTIEVVPAINDHAEVMENMQSFEFDYQPTAPLPEITDIADAGEPSVTIVSPKPGDTVSGEFDVVVEVKNFENSCDLYGKPGVAGYGHWHVNLDSTSGPMMGMGTMLGMSCTNTFKASTAGLNAGDTHSVIALLVDNGHAPFAQPVQDQVDVKVG